MSETEKLLKYVPSVAWILLPILLFAGISIHQNDYSQYWALWLTEAVTWLLVAFYFIKPSNYTAAGAVAGSAVWLFNQTSEWYGVTFGSPSLTFLATFIANIAIFGTVIYLQVTEKGKTKDSYAKPLGAAALALVTAYAAWKIVQLVQIGLFRFTVTPDWIMSGLIWAVGIMVMSAASIMHLYVKPKTTTYAAAIIIVGLMIAFIAALAYGTALSLLELAI